MSFVCEDPRILRGMTAQLARRRELIRNGQTPLGWKLAFGGPAAMNRLRIDRPLVGFLMASAIVPSGSSLAISGWSKPAAEPELTVCMGRDLPANSNRLTAMDAIEALGPAIEVADVRHPSEDVEGTLSANIYQRHVILGSKDSRRAQGVLDGLNARVFRNQEEIASTTEPQALTGELVDIIRHVANLLSVFGESLQAGQLIITGSITPPIWAEPGDEIRFQLDPVDAISVRFAPRKE